MSYRTRPGVSWNSSEVVHQERFTRESSSKSSDLSSVSLKNLSDESGENLGVLCRADSQALGFRVCWEWFTRQISVWFSELNFCAVVETEVQYCSWGSSRTGLPPPRMDCSLWCRIREHIVRWRIQAKNCRFWICKTTKSRSRSSDVVKSARD